jgi:deubiquitinase DESI2
MRCVVVVARIRRRRRSRAMALVTLNVYDIKHPSNPSVTTAVESLNSFTRHALNVGGIFHGAVEVFGDEYSFGYCDHGSGVYRCEPKRNSAYTYRESVALGVTSLSPTRVAAAVATLRARWSGASYDALGRNCNHFCEALTEALGCEGPPGWLNAFANGANKTRMGVEHVRSATEHAFEEAGRAVSSAFRWVANAASFGSGVDDDDAARESASAHARGASDVSEYESVKGSETNGDEDEDGGEGA